MASSLPAAARLLRVESCHAAAGASASHVCCRKSPFPCFPAVTLQPALRQHPRLVWQRKGIVAAAQSAEEAASGSGKGNVKRTWRPGRQGGVRRKDGGASSPAAAKDEAGSIDSGKDAPTSSGSSKTLPAASNNGDPLGRKLLGRDVVTWLAQGMGAMAADIADAEARGEKVGFADQADAGVSLVILAQPYLGVAAMPMGHEALCLKVSTHYPTLFDHLQRELQAALQRLQAEGVVENWQQTAAWAFLKKLPRSGEHRESTRKSPNAEGGKHLSQPLGLSPEQLAETQANIDAFVKRALELLRIERDAELEATQEALDSVPLAADTEQAEPEEEEEGEQERRDTISDVTAVSSSTGLGGAHLVSFRAQRHHLPQSTISPGDMVCVRIQDKNGAAATECMRGYIYSLSEDHSSITVSIDARYGDPVFSRLFGRSIRIDRISELADVTTYQRDCDALDRLQKQGLQKRNPSQAVVATLFAPESALSSSRPPSPPPGELSGDFDYSQLQAVELGLDRQRPVVVIQGPPGTGKTSVVVELIRRAVARGERVLATAPTNAAVDNLVERLGLLGLNVVRVGNPYRVAPAVVARSLSSLVEARLQEYRQDIARRRADLRTDLRQTLRDDNLGAGIRQVLKQLGKALKQKEKQAVAETLQAADVVLSTNTGAADPLLLKLPAFDLAVVDEAGQAIEPSSWIPALQARRLVLAGDVNQLAPCVMSRSAMEGGLGISLMERAAALRDGALETTLRTQYRMHAAIAGWASQEMYHGRLQSAKEVESRLLSDLPGVNPTRSTRTPMLLLDTRSPLGSLLPGCQERIDNNGTGSYYNEGEADVVAAHVAALLAAGVAGRDVAVLSPYLAQVQLLQERLEEMPAAAEVEVASVDSFQGREAPAVVISMVRSNSLQVVGFLGDRRRMNVAVTRAMRHVAVVCDSATVGRNAFLKRLLQHIRMFGEVRSAEQQQQSLGLGYPMGVELQVSSSRTTSVT